MSPVSFLPERLPGFYGWSVFVRLWIYFSGSHFGFFLRMLSILGSMRFRSRACTTWTLTKRLERRLDGNYTRILRAVLNKSWRQHPTRLQLYGHLPPITKTIQVRRTRHAGHCWRSKDELISDVLLWTPHMDVQEWDDQHEHTYSNYVRTQDVTLKTCRRRWMIGINGERGSRISALAARHDDDDNNVNMGYLQR